LTSGAGMRFLRAGFAPSAPGRPPGEPAAVTKNGAGGPEDGARGRPGNPASVRARSRRRSRGDEKMPPRGAERRTDGPSPGPSGGPPRRRPAERDPGASRRPAPSTPAEPGEGKRGRARAGGRDHPSGGDFRAETPPRGRRNRPWSTAPPREGVGAKFQTGANRPGIARRTSRTQGRVACSPFSAFRADPREGREPVPPTALCPLPTASYPRPTTSRLPTPHCRPPYGASASAPLTACG